MEFMDLELAGGNYTGRRGERHTTIARLDRFLFSELEVTKSYFKFENWWLNTKGFNDRIRR